MTTPLPPQPKLRSIGLGILIVVVMVVLICSASSMVKWAGSAFLVLPRIVGLLGSVRGGEIVTLPMDSSPTAVVFPRPEKFLLYTGDLELLEIAANLQEANATPWLVVQRADTGEVVPVSFVRRGLMPYDDPRAPGRPTLAFEIAEPGTYALSHPRRAFPVALVPDRTSGKEGLILGAFMAQLALLALPATLIFGRPWLERRRAWRRHQQERRRASETMMRRRTGRPS
jgi:hypothetical protein